MGSGIDGICRNCGYEAFSTIGGGMADHAYVSDAPAICRVCREVVTVNLLEGRPPFVVVTGPRKLLHCGQPVELIGTIKDDAADEDETDEDAYDCPLYVTRWGDYMLEAKHHPCPKCGLETMWWQETMLFD